MIAVMGTRPEVIKLAPVVKLMNIQTVCSGQHGELAEFAAREFGIEFDDPVLEVEDLLADPPFPDLPLLRLRLPARRPAAGEENQGEEDKKELADGEITSLHNKISQYKRKKSPSEPLALEDTREIRC